MSGYHEKVARRMSESLVGVYSTYEEILAALLRKYPDEAQLRVYVATMERIMQERGAPPGWTLVGE